MLFNGERKFIHLTVDSNKNITNDGNLQVVMPAIDKQNIAVIPGPFDSTLAIQPLNPGLTYTMKTQDGVVVSNGTTDWTVAAWVKATSNPGQYPSIFGAIDNNVSVGVHDTSIFYDDTPSNASYYGNTFKYTHWHHIAACCSSKTSVIYLFIDGKLAGAASSPGVAFDLQHGFAMISCIDECNSGLSMYDWYFSVNECKWTKDFVPPKSIFIKNKTIYIDKNHIAYAIM